MRAERIVRRQNLKQQLEEMKRVMRDARPFIEAQQALHRAYSAGLKQGMEISQAAKDGELATVQVAPPVPQEDKTPHDLEGAIAKLASFDKTLEPCADTTNNGSTGDPQQETPVS